VERDKLLPNSQQRLQLALLSRCRDVLWLVTEKDLILEIDRLRHYGKNGTLQHGKRAKARPTDSVETFISDLEEERNYWRGQVTELQQMMRSWSHSPSRSRSRSLSPAHRSAGTSPTRRQTVSRATSPLSPATKVCPSVFYQYRWFHGCRLTQSMQTRCCLLCSTSLLLPAS